MIEIKVDNVNGKHSAVFKSDAGVNEVLISKLLGVLKWLRIIYMRSFVNEKWRFQRVINRTRFEAI